jgi:hypothetical protein
MQARSAATTCHNKNRNGPNAPNAMTATNEYNDDKAMIPRYAQTLATAGGGEASRLLQPPLQHRGRRRRRRCHSASGGPLLLLPPDDAAVGTTSSSLQNVRAAVSKLFTESVAAHMHSVGVLGEDERLDETGTLHYYYYVTVQTKHNRNAAAKERHFFNYGALHDLFHPEPPLRPQVATADKGDYEGEGDAGEEEQDDDDEEEKEEEEMMDVVEGGSLSAAIFGIIKGTVGPAILYLPRGTYSWGRE